MARHTLLLVLLCGVLAGCGITEGGQLAAQQPATASGATSIPAPSAPALAATTTTKPAPTGISSASETEPADLKPALQQLLDGFTSPTHVTAAGDGSGRLFVVEQAGTVRVVRDGRILEQPFLDIRERVGSSGNEQGLLSIAFHPRYSENGSFFLNYTDRDGDTVVARYGVSANPDQADAASEQLLLRVEQPAANHNGGMLKFGPDGYLYIGMGDGGRAGDPWDNAQNLATLLGKLLRIDVDGGEPYAVPSDNPFVGRADARPEIWAWGLRNPWRFSFDRTTGDLYIADVGQNQFEEIHFQPASSSGGENYGWNIMEGNACYNNNSCDQQGLVLPVAAYSHDDGCSVTGGYVYRGETLPELVGVYLYADFCSGKLWALRGSDGQWENRLVAEFDAGISSFGEDEAGELYLVDRASGALYRLALDG